MNPVTEEKRIYCHTLYLGIPSPPDFTADVEGNTCYIYCNACRGKHEDTAHIEIQFFQFFPCYLYSLLLMYFINFLYFYYTISGGDTMKYNFSARRKGKGWQLVMDYKDDTGWHQKTKSGFERKQDAMAYRQTLLAAVKKTVKVDKRMKGMTLMQFAEMYVSIRKDLTFNTKERYVTIIAHMPLISDMDISKIRFIDVEKQFSALDNLKPSTRQSYRIVLKTIFSNAVKYKAIAENPIEHMNTREASLSKSSQRLRTFTKEEVQFYIEHGADTKYNIIICLCAMTGMRVGEALGLQWKNIDLAKNEITVDKQYKRLGKKDGKPVLGFGAVKNKNGVRVLHMPPRLKEKLLEWKDKSPLYFDGRITNIRHAAVIGYTINQCTPGHSVHDFRHTFATEMLASGVDVRTVAALLGDTLATIEKTYLHYTDDMRRTAASHIDKFFG